LVLWQHAVLCCAALLATQHNTACCHKTNWNSEIDMTFNSVTLARRRYKFRNKKEKKRKKENLDGLVTH